MTTLVTGAGLVGVYFAREAIKRGEKLLFLDPFPRSDFLAMHLGDAAYEVIADDVRNLPALADAMGRHKVETVVHTASRIGHRAAHPIHEGFNMNIGGTQAVAEAVRLSGVRRLVHISTFGAYDWRRPMPEPVREDFPRGSGVPYGNFKAAQELILEAYRNVYEFELIMLRPCNVYGVGHFWAGSGGGEKVQDILLAGLTGKPARIPEEQTMAFEYLYAKDVGRAVEIAATCPAPKDIVFNIGSGVTTRFDDLLATAQRLLPKLSVEIAPGTPPVSREQHLDTARAREQLGWEPAFSLEKGFADYIEDLRRKIVNRSAA